MKHYKLYLLFVFTFGYGINFSQTRKIDSLKTLLKKDKEDTIAVAHLNAVATEFRNLSDFDSALYYGFKSLQLAGRLKPEFTKGLAITNSNIGITYFSKGEHPLALEYFINALKIEKKINDKKRITGTLGRIGTLYKSQGNYPRALKYYFEALKIAEETGDKKIIVTHLSNVALVFSDKKNDDKALSYDNKALQISESINDYYSTAVLYVNIGVIYAAKNNYLKAIDHYFRALKLGKQLDNKSVISSCYGNLGNIYTVKKNYDSSAFYYFKALKIAEEMGDKTMIAIGNGNVASDFLAKKKFEVAEQYYLKALAIDSSIGFMNHSSSIHLGLSGLYYSKGDFKKALEQYKNYSVQKDSMFNIEKNKAFTKHEMNYEFEKKEIEVKADQDKKDAVTLAENNKQKLILALISSALILVIIFAVFAVRTLRLTRKQKLVIEIKSKETQEQKRMIEEKNTEILDSIHYAKRIQQSLLPTEVYIERILNK